MLKTSFAIGLLLVVCGIAGAIINPQLTPRKLMDEADLVIVGTVAKDGDNWKVRVDDAVKGHSPDAFTLDLSHCDKDQLDQIRTPLADNASRPAVLVATNDAGKGHLHIGGTWMEVSGAGDRWQIRGNSSSMTGTFPGGTDMLARMVKHLAEHPDATVPSTVGVKWTDNCVTGHVPGASALATIEWPERGKPALFVASSQGDHLLEPRDKENAFTDVTAAAGLSSKSTEVAFLDVDGDGIADLVSYDGAAINVYLVGREFKSAGPKWNFKIEGCIGLAPCSIDGHPAMLASTHGAPILLAAQPGGWKQIQLAPFKADIGHASACVVADLDNDGYADVLQPGETGGALWKGKDGGFQEPVNSPVCTGGGTARHALADFSEDGFVDIFLAGTDKNTLWENDGKGGFIEVMRFAGSLSYKCPAGAEAAMAMDLNHDGRADLCLGYPNGRVLYHFNRGFRSLAEEGEFRLPDLDPPAGAVHAGLLSFAVADFNGDNSADLAILQSDGTARVYFNDRVDESALLLRLPRGAAGPVTVSCWTAETPPSMTGLALVAGHSPGAYLPIRDAGAVHLRYRFPGHPPAEMKVIVTNSVKEVLLDPAGAWDHAPGNKPTPPHPEETDPN